MSIDIQTSNGGSVKSTRRRKHTLTELLISQDELTELLAISGELEDERPIAKAFNTHNLYMQFLQLSLAGSARKNLPPLSLNEQHLLEQIAVHSEMDKPIKVADICRMTQFGCASTVRHLIHKLNAAGLIHVDAATSTPRRKFINLSQAGRAYFQEVEDCLDKALFMQ